MNIAQLIKMANQIGAFFASQPDPLQAREDLAQHLKRFWDPQMREELYGYLDAGGGEELSAIVRDALQAHRELVRPATQRA
ncbi:MULTISPECIES: formate dehydrogenase subunit delta [unclassified Pseudomonas]|uniref:formate dehydrogenase subunit delta n=1 Tax=unclassified Pseudomonas TaxID=196821 RepID=UPI001C49C50E|nr:MULTISPECIES: formate dehydrogenase subunit delta [unclassified Pseudomonas]